MRRVESDCLGVVFVGAVKQLESGQHIGPAGEPFASVGSIAIAWLYNWNACSV